MNSKLHYDNCSCNSFASEIRRDPRIFEKDENIFREPPSALSFVMAGLVPAIHV
jgi:hypothetical protein